MPSHTFLSSLETPLDDIQTISVFCFDGVGGYYGVVTTSDISLVSNTNPIKVKQAI